MERVWFERMPPPEHLRLLDGLATLAGPGWATPENPLVALPGAVAILAGARIRYDGSVMERAPTLRVISRMGMGTDNIVIADATARGIAVCYTPEAPTTSTAEHAILLILGVAKNLPRAQAAVRRGGAVDHFSNHQGLEVAGLRLGLVGLGRIGSHVAKVALALGMIVDAYDPQLSSERAKALGVGRAESLESLLAESDVVSLHLPLTPETYHLIDANRLSQMKRGAILINTSRGGLVHESALLDALDRGALRGAGIDVFEREPPPPDHPLLHRDDVIATAHIAAATFACKNRLWSTAIAQVAQVLRGERPTHLLNPEVWSPA
jgi:D-3-phosphoglycerate dehydrogenase